MNDNLAEKARQEAMLEELVQIEAEKQRIKEDKKRRLEEEAKIQLMREVYESRATKVEEL